MARPFLSVSSLLLLGATASLLSCTGPTTGPGPGGNWSAGGDDGQSTTGGSGGGGKGGKGGGGGKGGKGGALNTGGNGPGAGGRGVVDASEVDEASEVDASDTDTGGGNDGAGGRGDAPTTVDAPVKADRPVDTMVTPDGGTTEGCTYKPAAGALGAQLKFEKITLTGFPAPNGMTKDAGYAGGLTEIKFLPGTTNEFFLTRKAGLVYHFRLDGAAAKTASLVKSFTLQGVSNFEDCGLIGLAFDPDFKTNKFVYFGHCTGQGRSSEIRRYKYENNQLTNAVTIIGWNAGSGGRGWHSMGSIGFDRNQNLWAVHGEFNTGAPAQSLTSNLGKLIRVIPSRDPTKGGYTPAPGNPYEKDADKIKAAVYAYGFRSPWRAASNAKGHFIIGDVGPARPQQEEVNYVSKGGQNLGWNNGTCNAGNVVCWGANYPMLNDLDDKYEARAGRAVWVSPQYGDCGNDRYNGALTGAYLVGDFFAGWVVGILIDDTGKRTKHATLGFQSMISAFDQAPDGYLYLTRFGNYHQGADNDNEQGLYRVLLAP